MNNSAVLLDTKTAAQKLGFKAQTLRVWAMNGSGPIQPIKIGNRLRWRVADIEQIARPQFSEIVQN